MMTPDVPDRRQQGKRGRMLIFVRLLRSTIGRMVLRFAWRRRALLPRLVRGSYLARMIRLFR